MAPPGYWSKLDLIFVDGKSIHIVNGQVIMRLFNSTSQQEDGSMIPWENGMIALQSEGAEVFFRNIRIREIDQVPD